MVQGSLKCIDNSAVHFACEWRMLRVPYSCCQFYSSIFHPICLSPSYLRCKFSNTYKGIRIEVFLNSTKTVSKTKCDASSVPQAVAVSVESKLLTARRNEFASEITRCNSFEYFSLKLMDIEKTIETYGALKQKYELFISLLDHGFIIKVSFTNSLSSGKTLKSKVSLPYPIDLVQDLKKFYRESYLSDVTICVEDKTLHAHKSILIARSSVFRVMMAHDCLESNCSKIIITDCDFRTFDIFLNFLYTGDVEDKSLETAMSLYPLSDKYDVEGLRTLCFEIIRSKFDSNSVDNPIDCAGDILLLAHRHTDQTLKNLASGFISDISHRLNQM